MRAARSLFSVVAAALLTLAVAPAASADSQQQLPVPYTLAAGVTAQLAHPDSPPPGANDWHCKPSKEHPNPVVLTHGLAANQTVNWQTYAPLLANEGYCVFSLTYGTKQGVGIPGVYQPGGLQPMQRSAREFGEFVDKVLRATGAAEVDILGHSEGTLMPSYYVRKLDGASNVDKYVSITPLWEGTTLAGLSTLYQESALIDFRPVVDGVLNPVCESCTQFLTGSDFLKELHRVGIFDPDVEYTNIVTKYDELVLPYTSGLAKGPNITNIVLQNKCALDLTEHAGAAADPVAAGYVLNALDPANAEPVQCTPVTPLGGLG